MALSSASRTTLTFSWWSPSRIQELFRESAERVRCRALAPDWIRFHHVRWWVRNTKQRRPDHLGRPSITTRSLYESHEKPAGRRFKTKQRLMAPPQPTYVLCMVHAYITHAMWICWLSGHCSGSGLAFVLSQESIGRYVSPISRADVQAESGWQLTINTNSSLIPG